MRVIVIGGGHNGLIAAALLAKRGADVMLLERRDVVGGAAITERPFGPDYAVTTLSYVVSLLPPAIVRALELERHGYHVYPQHGYFAPRRDGRSLQMHDDPSERRAELAKFSKRDAEAWDAWDAWLTRLGAVLGPMLSVTPPRVGSKRAGDLWDQARLAWRLRALDERAVADVTRLMTSSVADLVEERFESDAVRGVLSVSGVIGTWAGPRSPGTAYVMAHHKMGDVGQGQQGAWGFPRGGMGGVTQALLAAAQAHGVTVRTSAPVKEVLVEGERATGVVLEDGTELRAEAIVATTHPKTTFLSMVPKKSLPPDFVGDIERWKTRSGTVKVNVAVDRLPEFACKPGFDPTVHGGTIVLAESLDDVEGAFQDAVRGEPARLPFADVCIPSVFDDSLAPEGHHVVSMFTQWVPHGFASAPHRAELEAYADRVIARMDAVAPGFASSVLHRQVVGPHEMQEEYGLVGGNIFHGELSASQIFHMRPAPGYADYRTPIPRLYQASSATHGGGGVTGLPALAVVQAIARDHGL